MIDNPALDIAIGLFFTYAIYSLIATTFTEMVSTLLNQRGKMLQKGLARMLDPDKPNDWGEGKLPATLSTSFFQQPVIKYIGKPLRSGKSRFPSYLKPKIFSKALLNTLGYMYDEKTKLDELRNKLDPKNEKHKFIIDLIDEADNSIERFKALAEDWFNETMERVAGWYKRRVHFITFVVGLFIAYGLNINSIEIAKKLGTDKEARAAMVNMAIGYLEEMQSSDSIKPATTPSLESMEVDMRKILKEASKLESIIEVKYPSFFAPKTKEWQHAFWSYVFGCFITAIALSLGSPFWFDLLNKLIKLRASGVQEKIIDSHGKNYRNV